MNWKSGLLAFSLINYNIYGLIMFTVHTEPVPIGFLGFILKKNYFCSNDWQERKYQVRQSSNDNFIIDCLFGFAFLENYLWRKKSSKKTSSGQYFDKWMLCYFHFNIQSPDFPEIVDRKQGQLQASRFSQLSFGYEQNNWNKNYISG